MKEDCSVCGVTFYSDIPANVCEECAEEIELYERIKDRIEHGNYVEEKDRDEQ